MNGTESDRTASIGKLDDPALRYDVHERSIQQLQAALSAGAVTARELTLSYLERIRAFDRTGPALRAVVSINPQALDDAASLDEERRERGPRGPLHGIPILVKDNFDVVGAPTSDGALALATLAPSRDAFVIRQLRAAGAVILGKTAMHELAAGVTNVSSLTGFTRNPYDPRRVPGGSSGGSAAAVAASFAAAALGSDTCGSLRLPAACQALYTLRPSRGLASRTGIAPLSPTQDAPGPLARTVADLAIMLDATVGADPEDASTRDAARYIPASYLAGLRPGALKGLRIGVVTNLFGDAPDEEEVSRVVRAALRDMEALGAQTFEVDIPDIDARMRASNVIAHEFRFALADYLARFEQAPVRSLTDILEAGLHHEHLDAVLRARDAAAGPNSVARQAALRQQADLLQTVLSLIVSHSLDVLAYPPLRRKPVLLGEILPAENSQLSPATGLPALVMPAGWTRDGLPVGIELLGPPHSEQRLLDYAHHWEAEGPRRRSPYSTPSLLAPALPAQVRGRLSDGRARGGGENESIGIDYTLDRAAATLRYRISIGTDLLARVVAVTAHTRSGDAIGPVFAHLFVRGDDALDGVLALAPHHLVQWAKGEVVVRLTTTDEPKGLVMTPLEAAPG